MTTGSFTGWSWSNVRPEVSRDPSRLESATEPVRCAGQDWRVGPTTKKWWEQPGPLAHGFCPALGQQGQGSTGEAPYAGLWCTICLCFVEKTMIEPFSGTSSLFLRNLNWRIPTGRLYNQVLTRGRCPEGADLTRNNLAYSCMWVLHSTLGAVENRSRNKKQTLPPCPSLIGKVNTLCKYW